MGQWVPNEEFGAVCKNCKQHFFFSKYGMGRTNKPGVPYFEGQYFGERDYDAIQYPKGDLSVVSATCGFCNQRFDYTQDEITVPMKAMKADNELSNSKEKVKELESQMMKLQDELAEARTNITEKDKLLTEKVGNLAEAYLTLAKFIHEELPKMLQNSNAKKPSTSYEGSNT